VQFSASEKREIAGLLDALGVDYVEGGWPGANPTDDEFFAAPPVTRARLTAFGMTKRAGRSASNDDVLARVLDAGTGSVCLVGKADVFHVEAALGIAPDENLENVRASIAHVVAQGREAIFDAEHLFDGFARDPGYARAVCAAALEAGARWVVLCDTNGGTMPAAIAETVAALDLPGDRLGIHTHDDTGQAVAGTLAAVEAGVRHVQGTLNGLGERCGNANLTTLIPTLMLKAPWAGAYATGVTEDALAGLLRASRRLDDILNRVPRREAPYVGASAFAHKAGLHASAILKDPTTYEHVPPAAVGNARVVPMSNQAGLSNLRRRLAEAGLPAGDDDALRRILARVKEREDAGYAYDTAQASFELIAREELGLMPELFEVKRYRVSVERRKNKYDRMVTLSEAVVVLKVDGEKKLSVSESMDASGTDRGPVNALSKALYKDLGRFQAAVAGIRLTDYRVRIMQGGTEAVTRVVIDHEDGEGRRWSTVGVSPNIVDASFEALLDAVRWKLVQ
jgi:2-isopropylmalate synthase